MIATDWAKYHKEKNKKKESFECSPFSEYRNILPKQGYGYVLNVLIIRNWCF